MLYLAPILAVAEGEVVTQMHAEAMYEAMARDMPRVRMWVGKISDGYTKVAGISDSLLIKHQPQQHSLTSTPAAKNITYRKRKKIAIPEAAAFPVPP